MTDVQTEHIARTYDDFPYISGCFPQSSPEHLRATAFLFGLDAAPAGNARVLELGCAAGGNLIPFAARNPRATVVGVDLSAVQIEIGRRAIDAMGLTNLTLKQASIADLDASLGQFDYIVCHGVYSWVQQDVRAAILRLVHECLSPEGVAFISYNTYPGWKAKEILRDAMLLRAAGRASPQEALAYARGMVDFLDETAAPDSVLKKVVDENSDMIRHADGCYVQHEFLEVCNAPCYFRDFHAEARRHGLEYLAEAEVATIFASRFEPAVAARLLAECGGEQAALEQLMDFVTNRTFRQSVLVHRERAAQIRYDVDPARLGALHLAGHYVPQGEGRWQDLSRGGVITCGAETALLLEALNQAWPSTVAVADIVQRVASASTHSREEVEHKTLAFVRNLVIHGAVQFRLEPLLVTSVAQMQLQLQQEQQDQQGSQAGARPRLPDALRRLVAHRRQEGGVPLTLFNAWHDCIATLGAVEERLVPLLDGTRDRRELLAAVLASVESGDLHFVRHDAVVSDAGDIAATAEEHVARALEWFARVALLMPADKAQGAQRVKAGKGAETADVAVAVSVTAVASEPADDARAAAKTQRKPRAKKAR